MVNKIVVLGVSGSGKSTIGQMLADYLHYPFFDGDNFHSEHNVTKMRQGIPLSDQDRQEWLTTLNQVIQSNSHSIVACSALKPEYRKKLKQGNPEIVFVYLKGSYKTIWERHQKRDGHYFKGEDMLKSQFSTLVEPLEDEAISIDIQQSEKQVLACILAKIDLR
ncbi:gluconokinase [Marinomonas sp. 2405UD68-3]|uniref:gluconokinase n=1 Tax=Marinomonas sp. 2405UD68-3 TaxID=3391835 RepID=UPI0039C90EA8